MINLLQFDVTLMLTILW